MARADDAGGSLLGVLECTGVAILGHNRFRNEIRVVGQ
jgi:hypothetical protein